MKEVEQSHLGSISSVNNINTKPLEETVYQPADIRKDIDAPITGALVFQGESQLSPYFHINALVQNLIGPEFDPNAYGDTASKFCKEIADEGLVDYYVISNTPYKYEGYTTVKFDCQTPEQANAFIIKLKDHIKYLAENLTEEEFNKVKERCMTREILDSYKMQTSTEDISSFFFMHDRCINRNDLYASFANITYEQTLNYLRYKIVGHQVSFSALGAGVNEIMSLEAMGKCM